MHSRSGRHAHAKRAQCASDDATTPEGKHQAQPSKQYREYCVPLFVDEMTLCDSMHLSSKQAELIPRYTVVEGQADRSPHAHALGVDLACNRITQVLFF